MRVKTALQEQEFIIVAFSVRERHSAEPESYVRLLEPDAWANCNALGRTAVWMVSTAGEELGNTYMGFTRQLTRLQVR